METERVNRIFSGDTQAAATLMTDIECESPTAIEEVGQLYPHTGKAYVIGITGPAGVGKSTLINVLAKEFLSKNMNIGIVATDPSSPISGGAVLGDRLRFKEVDTVDNIFVRSVATRGWRGGLAKAVSGIVHVLDAMGKDTIIIETTGTGQGEVDIASMADTSVLLLMPGMGDEVQAMKAGALEIADIFAINKADMQGAENVQRLVEQILSWREYPSGSWIPQIVMTKAIEGTGIKELTGYILQHKDFLTSSGTLMERRRQKARLELTGILEDYVTKRIHDHVDEDGCQDLIDKLAQRTVDPFSVAHDIAKQLLKDSNGTTPKEKV